MASREPAGSPAAIPAERRAEKGATGPGTHPELAGKVGLAGEGPPAAYFGGGEVETCREMAALAATRGAGARFRLQGRRGGRGGAPRLVGEARGGMERRG
jgi:hypothetical protein